MTPANEATLERIRSRCTVDANGCWLWQGARNSKGYGAIAMMVEGRRKALSRSVHRVVVEIVHGPIPDGKLALHTCDVRNCVNPAHLYIGDALDNMRDARERGRTNNVLARRNAAKTHCPKGHPYDAENTRIAARTGDRRCIACARAADRRRTALHHPVEVAA